MASPTMPRSAPPAVVVAFLDGRRLRGFVFDFSALRDRCTIYPSQTAQGGQGEEIDLKKLKAIFFLQESSGEATVTPNKPSAAGHGRRLEVRFADGERLEGTTEGYSRERLGFFMVPEDETGKILRAFVINANVKEVKWLR